MRHHFKSLIATVLLIAGGQSVAVAADEKTMAQIEGTVTFFYYDDIQAAAPFYGELLQLPLTMDTEWVKIYQITATSSVGLVLQGRGFHEVAADKPAMLSMVTDDVDAWYERLKSANTVILTELPPANAVKSEGSAPVRGFVAQDPGGYTIEFFSWLNKP
ncbi:MAG: VOC family protein [Xanthomonadales bacterium]|nr:VOC family protein [Xanthomonadales bacterium]